MMMIYELSGDYAIILPLMVTCTIASAACHHLLHGTWGVNKGVLRGRSIRGVMTAVAAVPADARLQDFLVELFSAGGALPVLASSGLSYGVIQIDDLQEVWKTPFMKDALVASDVAKKARTISLDAGVGQALEAMDADEVDALPVVGAGSLSSTPIGVVTRAALNALQSPDEAIEPFVASTSQ
jgi:CIC family chloride channel protein